MNIALGSAPSPHPSSAQRATAGRAAAHHARLYRQPRPRFVARAQSSPSALPTNDDSDALPLWHGAWVGWLTCQTVLLVLVESTELASDPRIALATRALLVTAFVAAFRKPCFGTRSQRNQFTLCVLVAELGIAAGCNRLADTTGWPLWTAIAAALLLLATSASSTDAAGPEPRADYSPRSKASNASRANSIAASTAVAALGDSLNGSS